MSFYAFIPHIKVQGANLYTSSILLGGASLMASSLFAHHLARQLGVQDEGVIYIHHQREDLGEILKDNYNRTFFHPTQRRASIYVNKNDYVKQSSNISLQPTASCHLHFSLVIKFDEVIDLDDLNKILLSSRFAGGQIIEFGEVEFVKEKEFVNRLSNTIQTGFVLIDRQDVLVHFQKNQSLNRLQAFTHLLALNKHGLEHYFGKNHQLSFLSATNMGYALLEAPTTDRTGVRQAYTLDNDVMQTPHAYAEPLIGLVQYVSIRQLLNFTTVQHTDDTEPLTENQNPIAEPLRQLAENLHGLFWQYEWQNHDGGDVFLLKQTF